MCTVVVPRPWSASRRARLALMCEWPLAKALPPAWSRLLGPHLSVLVSLCCLSGPEDSVVFVIMSTVVVSRPWSASRRARLAL
eukprot:5172796-Pleurochrysis_carterae.AAC.1